MVVCEACGRTNPEGFKFCGECAAPLEATPATTREERKLVTVVFCDLVGFTSRAEAMDPEDVRALLAPYHERLRSELERFGGTVEKFIGDAVVAVFGAPVAHEDDSERAVRAALAIREWAQEETGLELRIAVNTGEALVSLGARPERGEAFVAGDVVNTAARLQSAAPTNGILVGETTYRSTRDRIDFRPAEPVVAKGKAEPVPVWEALAARSRTGVDIDQRPVAPLVGRERELELLTTAFARARAERSPQLVTLIGVPGIGKSRLVLELMGAVEQEQNLAGWRQGRSLPYGEGVTFWALGEIVKGEAGILDSDPAEEAEEKLRRSVATLTSDEEEEQWLHGHLRPLVGVGGDDVTTRGGEPVAAWRRFLEVLAEKRPYVVVFEDLHWADDALLDFVDGLVDLITDVPLLVLATARPELLERRPGWGGGKTNVATIALSPLPDDASVRLVSALTGRAVIAAEQQQALLAKIGGNPLYAEQYVRALVERDDLTDLPETVHGIIAARLDALSPQEKRLLQDAAVVGKVFWVGALEAAGDSGAMEIDDALLRLERKQFVQRARQTSVAGEREYAFRHVLLRDVAYAQIPRGERGDKHRRAAAWIESLARADDHAELVADHYGKALEYAHATGRTDPELVLRAGAALQVAGDRAVGLAAYGAAVRLYEAAHELSPGDPNLLLRLGRARFSADSGGAEQLEAAFEAFLATGDQYELAAEAALERRSIAWYDGDGDTARRWLDRALELVRGGPDSRAKAMALISLASTYGVNHQAADSFEATEAALAVVERLGFDDLRARAFLARGTARAALGDVRGLEDMERATEFARAAGDIARVHACRNNLSGSQLWFGRMAEAVHTYEELMEGVERFGRDTDRRWARVQLGTMRAAQGRWDDALALIEPFIAEVESGSPHYQEPPARVARASIRLARGDLEGASTDTKRALEAARLAGDAQLVVPALIVRATLLLATGWREAATVLVDETFVLGVGTDDSVDLVDLAWLARALGQERNLLDMLEAAPEVPWVVAARAIASGELDRAIEVLAQIGAPPAEAYTRLRAADELIAGGRGAEAQPHLQAALAFYREVGATYFVGEAEALEQVGAASAPRTASSP